MPKYVAKRGLAYGQSLAVRAEERQIVFALLDADGSTLAEIAADPYTWEDLLNEGFNAYHDDGWSK